MAKVVRTTSDKRKRVEKQWRKGGVRWTWSGDEDADNNRQNVERGTPRRHQHISVDEEVEALVVQTGGPTIMLLTPVGFVEARVKRNTSTENPSSTLVVIGDRVRCRIPEDGAAVITLVEARQRALLRRPVHQQEFHQVIVANVDQVVIVTAATEYLLRPGLIDRYILSAHAGGIEPLVCINKVDLLDEEGRDLVEEIAQVYREAGYPAVVTSCLTGEGIAALRALLIGKISAFSGHSGVGKTSLFSALLPDEESKISEVSEQSGRGVHTTSSSRLVPLGDADYLADTPGVREYGLVNIERDEVSRYYPEFVRHADRCRFPTCTHLHEPDCAILQAVEDGSIAELRYRNYVQIMESDEFA